jgi:hypothetical protein
MKRILACTILSMGLQATEKPTKISDVHSSISPVQNLFIITIDGFRWQELFSGADSTLINDPRFVTDTSLIKSMYWACSGEERRRKLMPFFWNVLAAKGQVYGNRNFNNKVNVSNIYSRSYAGYNEMFTGEADIMIASNNKQNNPNKNVLEYLNELPEYAGRVVAFTSWDVFPYILNKQRSNLKINSGYENMEEDDGLQSLVNKVENEGVYNKTETRQDELTFITAKEYISKFQPSIVYLSLGETDEAAHQGRYDLYLEKAAHVDHMLQELWYWVQSTAKYRDNTTFIVTTDHGRGKEPYKWWNHGTFVSGSSQAWLGLLGPNIKALGEMKNEEQIYQRQIAQTVATLVGQHFRTGGSVAPAIAIR